MPWKGIVRLWIVASFIAVPMFMYLGCQMADAPWREITDRAVRFCVNQEMTSGPRYDARACEHNLGADRTIFQQEGVTPSQYWGGAFLFGCIADLFATGVIALAVAAGIWVLRGFWEG